MHKRIIWKGIEKMKKVDFKELYKKAEKVVKKNSPAILTGIGVAGMVTTVFLTGKATIKAVDLIHEKEIDESRNELTKKEIISTVWKEYIPAVITGGMSIACVIGANSVSTRRNAALATAYQITSTAFSDYKQEVIATVGEKKERLIKNKVSEKQIADHPVTDENNKETVIIAGDGQQLCFDAISSRYFTSDMESIRKAENDLNKQMINENYISLNDYYSAVGLPPIATGNDLGWNIDDGTVEIEFGSHLASNGKAALTVNFDRVPIYAYNMFG